MVFSNKIIIIIIHLHAVYDRTHKPTSHPNAHLTRLQTVQMGHPPKRRNVIAVVATHIHPPQPLLIIPVLMSSVRGGFIYGGEPAFSPLPFHILSVCMWRDATRWCGYGNYGLTSANIQIAHTRCGCCSSGVRPPSMPWNSMPCSWMLA